MSLSYTSRVVYQVAMRAVQGIKDQASKSIYRDSSTYANSSSKQARRFSSAGSGGALDSSSTTKAAAAAKTADRLKQGEESLRTIMFLSCWGPN